MSGTNLGYHALGCAIEVIEKCLDSSCHLIQVSISKLACRHILGSPLGPFSSALALSLPDRKGAMISGMGGRVIDMVEFFCPP